MKQLINPTITQYVVNDVTDEVTDKRTIECPDTGVILVNSTVVIINYNENTISILDRV